MGVGSRSDAPNKKNKVRPHIGGDHCKLVLTDGRKRRRGIIPEHDHAFRRCAPSFCHPASPGWFAARYSGARPSTQATRVWHLLLGTVLSCWLPLYHSSRRDGAERSPRTLSRRTRDRLNSFIGICLIGDFSTGDTHDSRRGPTEPTAAQTQALIELITRLRGRYGIPSERVVRHHDVNPNTQCPGDRFPFRQLLEQLQQREAL